MKKNIRLIQLLELIYERMHFLEISLSTEISCSPQKELENILMGIYTKFDNITKNKTVDTFPLSLKMEEQELERITDSFCKIKKFLSEREITLFDLVIFNLNHNLEIASMQELILLHAKFLEFFDTTKIQA